MNKQEVLSYLKENRQFLNISSIGRAAGFPRLLNVLNGSKDGHGTPATLPDKYVEDIFRIIQKIKN